jgi:dolichyl-phosphooligosaccharide-protein glycotransferase
MPKGPVLTKIPLRSNAFLKGLFETGAIPDYAIPAIQKLITTTFINIPKFKKRMAEDLEFKFNSKKIIEFWKKYYLTIIVLLLIPMFLAGFFRAYTYDLPITESWAEQTVVGNIQAQVGNNILQQYPEIDQQTYNNLITQQTNLYLKENSAQINQQINSLSQQIKSQYQDDSGQTYLLAIDPYHYYRQAQNILENGHVGDEIIDGELIDDHMIAPNGKKTSNSLHPWIGATFYKISSIFGNDSLMKSFFAIPMIFAILSIIPVFFITRRVSNNLGGLVAGILLAISPVFLGRTPAGFSDTDVYNIFFPLMISWLFLESFILRYKEKKKKSLYAGLAGLFTGIFAFAWEGWWYIFDFIIASMILYLIYIIFKHKKKFHKTLKVKNVITTGLTYLASSIIFVIIFTGFKTTIDAIKGPLSFLFIKSAAHTNLWPNVYTTVAELGDTSLSNVINTLGGQLLFLLVILGILIFFIKKSKKQYDIKYGLFLGIWFIGTLYGSLGGLRFSMFLVPVYAIALGILTGKTYDFITKKLSKSLELNKKFTGIILILLITVMFISPIKSAHNTAEHEVPQMSDAWYNTLTKIKQETPENAIINSWWDFGHWFKAIADRKVTFDGASQNTPQAHWIGKVLLTDNEEEAIAILRMLDCGANDAYDLLLKEIDNPLQTKQILDEILLLNENQARNVLTQHTDNPNNILEKIFCNPPENYFITSEDMVSKSGVWAHFGSWDFEKALAYNIIKSNTKEIAIQKLKDELTYSEEEAQSIYRQLNGLTEREANVWIAPYPSYSNIGNCQNQNNTIICENGAIIKDNQAYVNTNNGQIQIKSFRIDNQIYNSNEGSEEAAIAYDSRNSIAILMQPELLESMFTELFFFESQYLNHFELFDHQVGINNFDIYVWKTKW